MYVCMYVCIYIYIYIYIYRRRLVQLRQERGDVVALPVEEVLLEDILTQQPYMCIYIYIYIYIYVCMYVCMYIYIYIYI